jgi:hypothetical protein
MKAVETIFARGHENILATHRSTLEFTKDTHLTRRGDCVIAVAASKGVEDLGDEFKRILKKRTAKLTIVVRADSEREILMAHGNPRLVLTHPADMVVRRSNFICDRTLAVQADKAARDISRRLSEKLKNPQQEVVITLVAEDGT